ncbi:MAG TPA: SIMPL domain-containing protein [Candidatus Gastranaerophilaceae bacterium]|nr:SIMPL domain-containing protein [Candidatus Gastranaerophilaceae bacterium]HPT40979.1 SIMPL domain-containing protein [Candidatus Gastranaerophilaceae bacterium]
MKKIFFAFLTVLLISVVAIAAEPQKEEGYISTSFSQTKEIPPNIAEISIAVETSAQTLQKASDDNKAICEKVYSGLKSIINTASGDYIKTKNYSARPVYVYTKENKKVFDKYIVSNTISVKTKNVDLVSKIIDKSIELGATNVNNLEFFAADYDSACNDLLAELTKKAYTQASSVATTMNSKVLGVKSINTTCSTQNNPAPYYTLMAKSTQDTAASTPIEGGKIKIYANVDASFYVK